MSKISLDEQFDAMEAYVLSQDDVRTAVENTGPYSPETATAQHRMLQAEKRVKKLRRQRSYAKDI